MLKPTAKESRHHLHKKFFPLLEAMAKVHAIFSLTFWSQGLILKQALVVWFFLDVTIAKT